MIRRESLLFRPRPATSEDTSSVSTIAVLDAWANYDWSEGFDLASLSAAAVIEVVTMRSIYHILATGAEVGGLKVRGGRYLPDFRAAKSIGSTLGGAVLKQNMVHAGFKMELTFDDVRLITSPVVAIRPLADRKD